MINAFIIGAIAFLGISLILHIPRWKPHRWERPPDYEKYRRSIRVALTPDGRRPAYVVIDPDCPPDVIEALKALAIAAAEA